MRPPPRRQHRPRLPQRQRHRERSTAAGRRRSGRLPSWPGRAARARTAWARAAAGDPRPALRCRAASHQGAPWSPMRPHGPQRQRSGPALGRHPPFRSEPAAASRCWRGADPQHRAGPHPAGSRRADAPPWAPSWSPGPGAGPAVARAVGSPPAAAGRHSAPSSAPELRWTLRSAAGGPGWPRAGSAGRRSRFPRRRCAPRPPAYRLVPRGSPCHCRCCRDRSGCRSDRAGPCRRALGRRRVAPCCHYSRVVLPDLGVGRLVTGVRVGFW